MRVPKLYAVKLSGIRDLKGASCLRIGWRLAGFFLLFTFLCHPAYADELTVKGTALRGTVVDVTAAGVVIQTEYGEGTITVALEDIEALSTDTPLYILLGDGDDVSGRLLGVERGMLLVGDDSLTAKRIDVRSIVDAATPQALESWAERIRHQYRFWQADVNVGMTIKETTTDEFDLRIGMKIDRRKRPTRFVGELNYLLGREKEIR